MRPLIGVTTSEMREAVRTHPLPTGDPPQREMALGMVYLRAVERAGGIPVVLPPQSLERVGDLLDQLAGLCISGGPDIHPRAYHADADPELGETEPALDDFELALIREADARALPILGICRGAQALNVARGGTLFQHLPDVTDGSIDHRQLEPGRVTTHRVAVVRGSLLHRIVGTDDLPVNTFHHQAAEHLGRDLRVVATAPDGTIEAIEGPGPALYLGVQWHAEGLIDRPEHLALFTELVDAAADRRGVAAGERAAA
jgi:putative glutamine amidotransferase